MKLRNAEGGQGGNSFANHVPSEIPPNASQPIHRRPRSIRNLEMENGAGSEGRDPSGFLSEIIGAPVTVKLNSGVVYKGLCV